MNTNLSDYSHIHFIGIGGISMSGLAEILLSKNFTVSGSDNLKSALTTHLENAGAKILYGQAAHNITKDIDLVVYTAAIKADNPELMAARALNIPCITRAELLGCIMREHPVAIAVSGTHGKTTTTSMVSHIYLESENDPTILVGGILDAIGGNLKIGNSDILITEACEYTNSFLSFYPTTAVILNVCEDHMDFFKDIDHIRNSFKKFTELLPEEKGCLVINSTVPDYKYFTEALKCRVLTYGIENSACNLTARNIAYNDLSQGEFDLYIDGNFATHIALNVSGAHNIENALAAAGAAYANGENFSTIKKGLEAYKGTERRFELKGKLNGFTIIDDYAHHPDEITATLTTAKNYPVRDVWCIFQPHTYTRTKAFLKDFAKSLSLADKVILTDIYAAREKDTLNISSKDLLRELEALGTEAYYFSSFEDIENFVKKNCKENDLLITMGAGNVVEIGNSLLNK